MNATYRNEYDELEDCIFLACHLNGLLVLIELEGEQGWCSSHLVEEVE